jgi:curved DNA-binding protein CbpA
LEEGADLDAIETAYAGLAKRCAPDRFPVGSDEQKAAQEIFSRVEAAYNALKDALDPTAGRFDKLEL